MEEHMSELRRVCVTGAGGFIASWLVKLLLSEGYKVHGTVRDPSNDKNDHLTKLDKATENLQLFKADLLDYNTLETAISGCEGVFHVASPVILTGISNPEEELMKPALVGTRNVLKACSEANVKRVMVVSSVCSVAFNPDWPHGTIMDDSCWSNEEFCRAIEHWYSLSKTMAEKEAFRYAQETGLDVVTLCPSIVIGPLLQSTVNVSSFLLLDVLKGSSDLIEKDRNWHFVDVRDVADAALMIYEKPIQIGDLFDMLKNIFPGFKYPENFRGLGVDLHMSSEKLKKIGWKHRTLKEAISDSVQYYEEAGLLNLE
ncbi:hypothetical protein KFK09_026659 [Dendrobium nobile]|uniref:NAD-dependent epimerase/dehydratase domain-containing protein n=1 Tax=Dendrobium nobile TaxID=94219 RepID=A0A8T3A8C9_DENNO|nr:hypothetical protein KFK09_026659 [Dendrobium nobile]